MKLTTAIGLLVLSAASIVAQAQEFDVNSNYFFEERYDDSEQRNIDDIMASKTKQIWPGIDADMMAGKTKQIWPGIEADLMAGKTKQIWPGIEADLMAGKTKQIWPGIDADMMAGKTKQIWPGIDALKTNIDELYKDRSEYEKAAILAMILSELGISLTDLENLNAEN